MRHRFTIPVLWAKQYGQSMVQMIRDGKRAVLGMNIFTMNISLFYDPEKQLAVSQRRFAPQLYNDFQSSGRFNMVSLFRLKVELEKLVDEGKANKLKAPDGLTSHTIACLRRSLGRMRTSTYTT